ncbi:MAG: helix-hairpin-helix domain-containing protein [Bacilli bacterium]|nr:helix-hairpin-helix domain-containing protein [Bacilli bacterium]
MKKILLILIGIAIILSGAIFVLYKNNQSKTEEIVDIFKETENKEEVTEITGKTEEKENIEKIVVDIKGMVANPGVYEVDSTSRINDVIALAGGLIEGADTSMINLAKIVEDEMTIIIYSSKEVLEKYKEEVCICDCPLITNDACIEEQESSNNEIININTATTEELTKITGIGEAKAKSIIEYRDQNGKFNNIEEIKNVPGIGDSIFEKIKDYITV